MTRQDGYASRRERLWKEREVDMRWGSVVFKSVILLGLLFILASVLWGMAHREGLSGVGAEGEMDRYREYRPAPYTSYILIALVVLGIVVLFVSIYAELRGKARDGGATFGRRGDNDARVPHGWR